MTKDRVLELVDSEIRRNIALSRLCTEPRMGALFMEVADALAVAYACTERVLPEEEGDWGVGIRRYIVYDTRDGLPLIVDGTAEECARAMGMSVPVFYTTLSRCRRGTNHRWEIFSMEELGIREDADEQDTTGP